VGILLDLVVLVWVFAGDQWVSETARANGITWVLLLLFPTANWV